MINCFFNSERLLYRPYQIEDLHDMVKLRNEKSMRKWFYFQEPYCLTEEFAVEHINNSISTWNKKINVLQDECDLAVVLKQTSELIGNVGVAYRNRPDVKLDGLEIGYNIGEAHQNKGYATEAAKAAVEWTFERLREINAKPIIEAYIEHENLPSRKVIEKAGFTLIRNEKYVSVYQIKG